MGLRKNMRRREDSIALIFPRGQCWVGGSTNKGQFLHISCLPQNRLERKLATLRKRDVATIEEGDIENVFERERGEMLEMLIHHCGSFTAIPRFSQPLFFA